MDKCVLEESKRMPEFYRSEALVATEILADELAQDMACFDVYTFEMQLVLSSYSVEDCTLRWSAISPATAVDDMYFSQFVQMKNLQKEKKKYEKLILSKYLILPTVMARASAQIGESLKSFQAGEDLHSHLE
ncbi:hypothetical protein RRG08_018479 [Elysia crispata]|uniref:Uncharacterized protein n=1 Tax=Elysia crispata TaxID=231223 RepID=A0AAE0YTI5_9GAST|nr:hypothetical protein RRG08_018479 [Elysia crispata]